MDNKNFLQENEDEKAYLELLKKVYTSGNLKDDRTNVGTLSCFGERLTFSLENNTLPLLTTKKMFVKGIIEELLMFLRGCTDTTTLSNQGIKIWEGNTSRDFLDSRNLNHLPVGSLGKGYSFQWRNFGGTDDSPGFDQVANLIEQIKTNPNSRRLIISAWNPLQSKEMALEPCHVLYQFYVNNGELSCHLYQRSADLFLGVPFNICSASLLTHIVAKMTNLKSKQLIISYGDAHIYNNHISQVITQIDRIPYKFPTIEIPEIDMNFAVSYKDFKINNYIHHESIKAEMAI